MFVKGANTNVCAEQSGKVNIQEEQYVILCTKAHASHATKLSARKMLNVFSGSFSLLRAGKEREASSLQTFSKLCGKTTTSHQKVPHACSVNKHHSLGLPSLDSLTMSLGTNCFSPPHKPSLIKDTLCWDTCSGGCN